MKRLETINHSIAVIVCIFCALLFALLNGTPASAAAAADTRATSYSNALEDLQIDDSFNAAEFPSIENDYSLSVIQIGESTARELFVYVYQPCAESKRLIATSINISTGINENLSYKNYKLMLLNSNGVFFKYLVKEFTVKSDIVRYYDISSIYRPWNEALGDKDLPKNNENEISEVSFPVEKQYTFCTSQDGNTSCTMTEPEYILITDKYVGRVRYGKDEIPTWLKVASGGGIGIIDVADEIDSWFVAFSTDFPIETLMEADVYYVQQNVGFIGLGAVGIASKKFNKYAYLKYTDKKTVEAGAWNKTVYSWDLIQSVEKFKESVHLTNEGIKDLDDKQWVLRFAATEYSAVDIFAEGVSLTAMGSLISDVTILRLKFETDGKVYNLGVVDNKQSPAPGQAADGFEETEKPDKPEKDKEKSGWDKFVQFCKDAWVAIKKFFSLKLPWWIYAAVIGVVLAIVLPILGIFLPPVKAFLKLIFKGLWKGIKFLFKALWWLICLPFRGIAALVRRARKNKKQKPEHKEERQIRF